MVHIGPLWACEKAQSPPVCGLDLVALPGFLWVDMEVCSFPISGIRQIYETGFMGHGAERVLGMRSYFPYVLGLKPLFLSSFCLPEPTATPKLSARGGQRPRGPQARAGAAQGPHNSKSRCPAAPERPAAGPALGGACGSSPAPTLAQHDDTRFVCPQ